MTQNPLIACTHCQTLFTPKLRRENEAVDQAGDPQFCCQGCELVYGILHKTRYYDIRKSGPQFAKAQPIAITNQSDSHLDMEEGQSHYWIAQDPPTMRFYIGGIHCLACLWVLERLDHFNSAIIQSQLNVATSVLTVSIQPTTTFSQVTQLIRNLGYRPRPLKQTESAQHLRETEFRSDLIRLAVAGFSAANIMMLALSVYAGASGETEFRFNWLSLILCLPAVTYSAYPIYKSAWANSRHAQMSIDIPITVAVVIGMGISIWHLIQHNGHVYFDTLSMFIFLMTATRLWLKRMHARLEMQLSPLDAVLPEMADRQTGNRWEKVPISQLIPNDIIRIAVGEKVPADGRVLSQEVQCNCQILTGESFPETLKQHDPIFAGTQVNSDAVIRVEKTGDETRLGQIVTQLSATQKPRVVNLADRVSRWFLWVVLGLFGFALALPAVTVIPFEDALQRALAIIIVACPCALALATPLAVARALLIARQKGVVIRSSDALEKLPKVKTIIWDKTGTLTTGQIEVIDATGDCTETDAAVILGMEHNSPHPIGRAIYRYFQNTYPHVGSNSTVTSEYTSAKGIHAQVYTDRYTIAPNTTEPPTDITASKTVPNLVSPIKTASKPDRYLTNKVVIQKNNKPIYRLTLSDTIHAQSETVIDRLRNQRHILLSGDHEPAVKALAQTLKLDDYFFKQSAQDKHDRIKIYQSNRQENGLVLMVGDGANDALALAQADVAIAVKGSLQMSLQAADIYLSHSPLTGILHVMHLAQQTRRTILSTITVSLLYNAVTIVFALLGLVTPLAAAIIMPISSLTVLVITVLGIQRGDRSDFG